MILLNLGCGSNRPQEEYWWNLDDLYGQFPKGTPEREQLDKEPRYVNHCLPEQLPFEFDSIDGILASHIIEHFDIHDAVRIMADCHRVLKPGGILVVSVPDANYFLEVIDRDTKENAIELFGEPIHDEWQPDFFSYALFHAQHKQVLCYDSLMCLMIKAGFDYVTKLEQRVKPTEVLLEISKLLNRRKFSLEMCAIKSA